jgi:hypothetical protein
VYARRYLLDEHARKTDLDCHRRYSPTLASTDETVIRLWFARALWLLAIDGRPRFAPAMLPPSDAASLPCRCGRQ